MATSSRSGPAEPLRRGLDALAHGGELGGRRGRDRADAGRRPVLAEDLAERAGPFADRAAGLRQLDRGRHEVLVGGGGGPQARRAPRVDRAGVARGSPLLEALHLLRLGRGVDHEDVLGVVGRTSGDGSSR